ncbi:MAG: cytochrome P450 [Gammaproteobacteria bacterium]
MTAGHWESVWVSLRAFVVRVLRTTRRCLAEENDARTNVGEKQGQPPSAADAEHLRYVERVLLETMRLYPPAYVIGREAMRDCKIDGYSIPAGATVFMSPWVMHRDPRYFEDPQAFRPARWGHDQMKRLPRYAYFPFGGGPRICIGNTFAMMEGVLLLATIAQNFRFELLSTHPVTPDATVTLRPRYGIKMRLSRR